MSFTTTGPHHCPKCAEDLSFREKVVKIRDHPTASDKLKKWAMRNLTQQIELDLMSDNYSGTGTDVAGCPRCKKVFAISYGVVAVEEVSWEGGYVG